MPREKEDYRDNIAQLNRLYPDREMLTIREVMQIMGYKSPVTARKYVTFNADRKVSKAKLAKIMCG